MGQVTPCIPNPILEPKVVLSFTWFLGKVKTKRAIIVHDRIAKLGSVGVFACDRAIAILEPWLLQLPTEVWIVLCYFNRQPHEGQDGLLKTNRLVLQSPTKPRNICLVGLARIELATSSLSGMRSNRLSYSPVR